VADLRGVKWWVPALGLVVTATAVTAGFAHTIEHQIESQATVALHKASLDVVAVDASYRSLTLTGPPNYSSLATRAVWAVRLVTSVVYLSNVEPTPEPSATPTPTVTPQPTPTITLSPSPSPTTPAEAVEAVLPEPQSVTFAVDSAELDSASLQALDTVATVMIAALEIDPTLRLSIAGHTDSVLSADYNQTLSEKRAASVRDYLVSKGVPADALVAVGYGESRPIATNETEAGRAANRRVDLNILED
jgi:outer membrane protein OmpA-like peptidoglycan-associated protein